MTPLDGFDPWPLYSRHCLMGDPSALETLRERGLEASTLQVMGFIWNELPWEAQYAEAWDYDYLQMESFLENQLDPRVPLPQAALIAMVAVIASWLVGFPLLGLLALIVAGLIVYLDRTTRSRAEQALTLLRQTNPQRRD